MQKALTDTSFGLYDFMMLTRMEQWVLISSKSQPLTTLEVGDKEYILYTINTFYLEIEAERFTKKFRRMSIFKTGKKLDKYFGGIRLATSLS